MGKVLPRWCKQVKNELTNRDMTVAMLAESIGKSREFTSAVINGRYYSEPSVREISDVLNIPNIAYGQQRKKLSNWCKQVSNELTNRDMKISDLSKMIGMSRKYVSAIVHGRVYSEPAVKEISKVLDIDEPACSLIGD